MFVVFTFVILTAIVGMRAGWGAMGSCSAGAETVESCAGVDSVCEGGTGFVLELQTQIKCGAKFDAVVSDKRKQMLDMKVPSSHQICSFAFNLTLSHIK